MAKLIVAIDDDLHQAFRIKCFKERRTMKDKITEFLKNDLGGVLEMDKKTLEEHLAGQKEIKRGKYITLEQAKLKFKVK